MATMKKSAKKYAMGGTVTTETTKPVSSKRVEFKKTKFDKNIEKTNKGVASGVRAKSGAKIKKAQDGSSLGMKSVKSGFDKNPGVTRADFVSIAKGTAKSGAKMKSGGKMKTCKGGC
jgi:hypothetical protein